MTDGTPSIGDTIGGKYVVEATLGRGGVGAVFRARHTLTDRRVALKWMIPSATADASMLQRFMREARAMGRIEHPNVVGVLDVGADQGNAFLVMELQRGSSLRPFLHDGERMTPAQAVALLLPALEGVAAAHRAGVVHRDLKPENLFVVTDENDRPLTTKVLDFGISKLRDDGPKPGTPGALTQTGTTMGTPSYMSPEQVRGSRDVDARTDIWALGAILYEMLAGRVPFLAESYGALMIAIAIEPCPAIDALVPETPPELASVVHRALEKDPANRFQRVEEMIQALGPFGKRSARPEMPSFPPPEAATARPSAKVTRDGHDTPTRPARPADPDTPTRAARPKPSPEPPVQFEERGSYAPAIELDSAAVRAPMRADPAFPERTTGARPRGRWTAAHYIGALIVASLVPILAILVSELMRAQHAVPAPVDPPVALPASEPVRAVSAPILALPDASLPVELSPPPTVPEIVPSPELPPAPPTKVGSIRSRETGARATTHPTDTTESRPAVSSGPGGRTGGLSTEEF